MRRRHWQRLRKYHRRPDGKGARSWLDNPVADVIESIPPNMDVRIPTVLSAKHSVSAYEIPPGFHYDVTEDSGRAFGIDIDGRSITLTHCNVTPWGHVRRG